MSTRLVDLATEPETTVDLAVVATLAVVQYVTERGQLPAAVQWPPQVADVEGEDR